MSPFPTVFSTRLDSFLPFSSNLKLSSANSISLEASKILSSGNVLIFDLHCLLYRDSDQNKPQNQGQYSPTILENIIFLVLQIFLYLAGFECNTTSDWLNHTNQKLCYIQIHKSWRKRQRTFLRMVCEYRPRAPGKRG